MEYIAPGVYVEETNLAPAIPSVATAVPAFVGYTEIAGDLLRRPMRIASLVEYERYFGGPEAETGVRVSISRGPDGLPRAHASLPESERSPHLLHYALRLYFANGGGVCYIVSVGAYGALDPADLHSGLSAAAAQDDVTLIVFPEAQKLSLADYASLHKAALEQCGALRNRFVIMDLHGGEVSLDAPDTPAGMTIHDAARNFRACDLGADNLQFGAVYAPNLTTAFEFDYVEAATRVTLDGVDTTMEILLTGTPPDVSSYQLAEAAIRALPCTLPPSGAVAGVYAKTDNDRGVWKAPANIGLSGALLPTIAITDIDQENLNVDPQAGKSINAIRSFPNRGVMVWGARTLAGNDNEWRYVSVRRFCLFVEESIRRGLEPFCFEPNDARSWAMARTTIENFLTLQWRDGALMGSRPSEAFHVAVGLGATMTALDVTEGRMVVDVALAPVRPAEFIILRLVQKMATA